MKIYAYKKQYLIPQNVTSSEVVWSVQPPGYIAYEGEPICLGFMEIQDVKPE